MFGRVPQPHVFHSYIVSRPEVSGDAIKSSVGIALSNDGPGIASDLFLGLTMMCHPGPDTEIRFDPPDKENWTGIWAFERRINLICKAGYRVPPECQVQPLILHITLAPPFENDMEFAGIAGAGGAPPYRFRLAQTVAELDRASREYLELHRSGQLTEDRAHALQMILFGHRETEGGQSP
jgi:hypothetical protein